MSKITFKTLTTLASNISDRLEIDNPSPKFYGIQLKSLSDPSCIDSTLFTGTNSQCFAFLMGMQCAKDFKKNLSL